MSYLLGDTQSVKHFIHIISMPENHLYEEGIIFIGFL